MKCNFYFIEFRFRIYAGAHHQSVIAGTWTLRRFWPRSARSRTLTWPTSTLTRRRRTATCSASSRKPATSLHHYFRQASGCGSALVWASGCHILENRIKIIILSSNIFFINLNNFKLMQYKVHGKPKDVKNSLLISVELAPATSKELFY